MVIVCEFLKGCVEIPKNDKWLDDYDWQDAVSYSWFAFLPVQDINCLLQKLNIQSYSLKLNLHHLNVTLL